MATNGIEITSVELFPPDDVNTRAIASVTLNGALCIRNIRIMTNRHGQMYLVYPYIGALNLLAMTSDLERSISDHVLGAFANHVAAEKAARILAMSHELEAMLL